MSAKVVLGRRHLPGACMDFQLCVLLINFVVGNTTTMTRSKPHGLLKGLIL